MRGSPDQGAPKERSARATRRAVAERAGVAETTVSLVLNGRGDEVRLAAATQKRVIDAARELRYLPSAAARALGAQRSRILGMAMSPTEAGIHAPVFADVALASIAQARESGYFVLQLPDLPGTGDMLMPIRDAGIGGLVCSTWEPSIRLGEELSQAGFPVVWIDPTARGEPRDDGPLIGIDPTLGVAELADHLWDCGRRSIALLIPGGVRSPARRVAPLLARFGPNAQVVDIGSWSAGAGRAAVADLLAAGHRPDAVFGANDVVAAGALHACRSFGLRVPDDIAVAGYGDFLEAEVVDPALTTVSWPLHELGRRAVHTLIRSVEGGDGRIDRHVALPTALVRRRSA